ncbi:DUF3828 domain-containing protein [Paraburkholderia phytofirmans]|jgi:hypothetical protein|uniref:DUF3828 domain-containing protein n=1 Tax=Paraburkholderia sp. BL9I2N2 TaxID=1938809 RepID=UPI0010ECBCAF|nr:DUF3828 domain-containing protein [Paraburkholderia sp. BL9I2N2]TCK95044.1 uncharacterized protein DUF3828 [Paraburkholderia sp. BL9I2N2]
MRLRACVLALIAWAVLSMQPAFAQSAASAQRFLQTVYSAYTFNGDPPGIEAAGSHAIASPSLLQLIRKDQRALKGEAGYLDMDPICRCQDFDVKTTGIEVTVAKRQKAKAVVSFTNFRKPNRVELDLVWVRGKWLIDDIRGSDDRRSLRDALQAEIADLVR